MAPNSVNTAMTIGRYEATTRHITVYVQPTFLEQESDPDQGYYFWTYQVEIENMSRDTVQLRSRFWKITDSQGQIQEVRGAGVVGQEPVIEPGESYSYISGTPLSTTSGIMQGSYQMEGPSGETFQIEIPAFSLDSPYSRRVLN